MFVVVNALYDVDFTVLNVEMSDTSAGSLATNEHMASSLQLSRKRARRLMDEINQWIHCNKIETNLPHPHGALFKSKINKPVLYWA